MSIFEKIGGEPAVNAAVNIFYDKVLADPSITHFFSNVEMDSQNRKQRAFFTTIFRGETAGADAYMRKVHQKLVDNEGLNEEHFGAVAGHLQATLEQLKVPSELVSQIMEAAAGLQDSVLCR